ncbi:MAG: hypothetical protein ACI4QM_05130 [Alphaproteobacteria bacterium]
MDLGLQYTDIVNEKNAFGTDDISTVFGYSSEPTSANVSAVQTLLNQGAEYLSQKGPFVFEELTRLWFYYLSGKSGKILSLTPTGCAAGSYFNPLVCPFEIGATDTGFIAFDWQTSYVLIDALLGGINGVSIEKKQNQPYSEIEKNILQPVFYRLVALLAEDQHLVIKPVDLSASLPFQEAHHTRLNFLVRTPAVTGKICIQLPTRYIPTPTAENLFPDPQALENIPVEITGHTPYQNIPLKEVLAWEVGTRLTFLAPAKAIVLNIRKTKIGTATITAETPYQIRIEAIK